jgi:hypothetical protein
MLRENMKDLFPRHGDVSKDGRIFVHILLNVLTFQADVSDKKESHVIIGCHFLCMHGHVGCGGQT